MFNVACLLFKNRHVHIFMNNFELFSQYSKVFATLAAVITIIMRVFITFLFCFFFLASIAQQPDAVLRNNIKSIKLFKYADPYAYPVIHLNSEDKLELHFDDMDADVKNYYYSYQLCNADWKPAMLQTFEYIKGFQDVRINNYRQSSIVKTKYTHYQAVFPDKNCVPSRSGNYLLKVFINGDTSKLFFTKRFFVVDEKSAIGAQVQQPFNTQLFKTHQKLQVIVNTDKTLNVLGPQDIRVVMLQNYSWPTAIELNRPNIYRGNYFEYYDENLNSFSAGKEWRWLDLRSLRLQSDRMQKIDSKKEPIEVYVRPDGEQVNKPYIYYRDQNGLFSLENMDDNNPYWQADYANVHFTYTPPGNKAFEGKSIYLFGELNNYRADESSVMLFNEEKGVYEKSLFLKQGFYNYSFILLDDVVKKGEKRNFIKAEGDYWATENLYSVFVYYRAFGGRADELIGYSTISSVFHRQLR